jgi:hypothetical protein
VCTERWTFLQLLPCGLAITGNVTAIPEYASAEWKRNAADHWLKKFEKQLGE